MIAEIYIDGELLEIVSNVSLTQSASNLISSLSFSTPINIMSKCESYSPIIVKYSGEIIFIGKIYTHKVTYSGKVLLISVECSDLIQSLSEEDRISFTPGYMVGSALSDLLSNTNLNTSLIGFQTTELNNDVCVFPVNSNRLSAFQTILDSVGAIAYIKYINSIGYVICDTWENILALTEFSEPIEISDASHLIMAFNLSPTPESTDIGASISISGYNVGLYNKLNLTELYSDMNITYNYNLWRISEIEWSINSYGIMSNCTLCNPDINPSKKSATKYTIDEMTNTQAEIIVDNSLPRVGNVVDIGIEYKEITIEYSGTGETEIIKDWTA